MNITLFHTKLVVNTYTALSLPFYAAAQKPWRRLKLSKVVHTQKYLDPKTNTYIWKRKGPPGSSPVLNYETYIEAMAKLDPNKECIGFRNVLEEQINFDEDGRFNFVICQK